MIPTFQISLDSPIMHGLVTIGKFDGKHPSLACATGAANILIHSPHLRHSDENQEVRQLDVNRRISALTSGEWPLPTITFDSEASSEKMKSLSVDAIEQMQSKSDEPLRRTGRQVKEKTRRHALLVGTQANLLCYDVEENSDLFYKDCPEGLNTIAFGTIPGMKEPLTIVGGSCSLQGFDHEGNEMFWTVTGDNVTALAFLGKRLIVGSEDYEIRVFEGEDVVMEATESDVVVSLTPIGKENFAFGLANGTIGVYGGEKKLWTRRYKHDVRDMAIFDLDDDGEAELITGWSNGRLDVRKRETGQEIFKERLSAPISGLCISDYRMQGSEEIIVATANGDIRGYGCASSDEAKEEIETKVDNMRLEALKTQKMALLLEKRSYENNLKAVKAKTRDAGLVPQETKLKQNLQPNVTENCMEVLFESTEGTVIKMLICESQSLFPTGTKVFKKNKPTATLSVPIQKDQLGAGCTFNVKAVVGHLSSYQDHIFESTCEIPHFCGFIHRQSHGDLKMPESCVTFEMNERVKSLETWINKKFGMSYEGRGGGRLEMWFKSIYNDDTLCIFFQEGDNDSRSSVKLACKDMQTLGDMIQELADAFSLKDLKSIASFPEEMKAFKQTIQVVEECDRTRLKLQADIAENVNLVKQLVVKAEDVRLVGNMEHMKRIYAQLYELNLELIGEYKKRARNHAELVRNLKTVNSMIQKAARLRTGRYKTQVVQECRKAIKSNNIHALVDIFRSGQASN